MKTLRPLTGLLIALSLGAALAGAGRAPGAGRSRETERFRHNLARWTACTDEQRDAFRASWKAWTEQPAAQRAQTEARFELLRRLRERLSPDWPRSGDKGEPSLDRLAAELTSELEGLTQEVRREAPEAPSDISLPDAIDLLLRRRIEAFLDHQEARGTVTAEEHARLLALPAAALAYESLLRLKADQIALLDDGALADELAACSPREVAARIDELQRQTGFLGGVGAALPLDAAERDELAALPTGAPVRDHLREMKAPAIRDRLQGRALSAEEVDALLAQPWNELQRSLRELLAGG